MTPPPFDFATLACTSARGGLFSLSTESSSSSVSSSSSSSVSSSSSSSVSSSSSSSVSSQSSASTSSWSSISTTSSSSVSSSSSSSVSSSSSSSVSSSSSSSVSSSSSSSQSSVSSSSSSSVSSSSSSSSSSQTVTTSSSSSVSSSSSSSQSSVSSSSSSSVSSSSSSSLSSVSSSSSSSSSLSSVNSSSSSTSNYSIKTDMFFWYNMSVAGSENLIDQHGISSDLGKIGNPTFTADYAVCNSTDHLKLFQTETLGIIPNGLTNDGTLMIAIRGLTGASHGDFIFKDVHGRIIFRWLNARFDASLAGVLNNDDTQNPVIDTDYILAVTWEAGSPDGTVEKWVNATKAAAITGPPVNPLNTSLIGSEGNWRIYWLAAWNRKLADAEIQDLSDGTINSPAVSTVYSDLI